MKKKILGKTNYSLSIIGIGSALFGLDYGFHQKLSQDSVNSILEFAYNNGINFIDTANGYGDSESKIGSFNFNNPNKFNVATKFKKVQENEDITKSLLKSLKESMSRLNVKYIDLILLHQNDDFLIKNHLFWETIKIFKRLNLIKSFGISVYDIETTIYLLNHWHELLDVLEIPLNIFDQRFLALKNDLKEKKIGVIVRSIFLQGMITCPIETIPRNLSQIYYNRKNLDEITKHHDVSNAVVALDFILNSDLADVIIVGFSNTTEIKVLVDHIKSNKSFEIDYKRYLINDIKQIDPRNWSQ